MFGIRYLLAFNHFVVGARGHVSAVQDYNKRPPEAHSSSGVLVCTGVGSTGWM